MRFRRKSSVAADADHPEPEARRRNRLSKPLTGRKISSSLSTPTLLVQDTEARSKNASAIELARSVSPVSQPTDLEVRRQIRNQVFDSDKENSVHNLKNDSTWSVAYMVNQIDKKAAGSEAAQPQPQTPPVPSSLKPPQKRKSLILRRLSLQKSSDLSRTPSTERVGQLRAEGTTTSTPEASREKLVDSPSIPPVRRASFTPGTATRKESSISPQIKMPRAPVSEIDEESNVAEEQDLGWEPRPPTMPGRAGTPADLTYSHLGGLRHGSLQIMNGRASPTLSDVSRVSKQLLAISTPHRDVSSDYGDPEEDLGNQASMAMKISIHRASGDSLERRTFSWESNDEKSLRPHPLQNVVSVEAVSQPARSADQTSLMAQEYMAELGTSPFEPERPSSPVGTIRRTRSEGSLWIECSSVQESTVLDADGGDEHPSSSDFERPSSPTGSVIRHASEERDHAPLRADEEQTEAASGHGEACESAMSWYSPVDATFPIDEAFQSALEFQVQPSPSRAQAPRPPEKSDSGYSSSNSLRSLRASKQLSPVEMMTLPAVDHSNPLQRPAQEPPTASLALQHRPSILKSRKTEPNLPTFANLRPSAVSSYSAPTVVPEPISGSTGLPPIKPVKPRKKLQKKQRSQPQRVALVRVASFDGDSIPAIPVEARENLRIRSQEVPELAQTTYSLNGLNDLANTSNLNLPTTDIRFPSPGPEPSLQVKRSRSRSRPRSWFGQPKEQHARPIMDSGISHAEARAIINDFGSASLALGSSPYDLASEGMRSARSRSPSVVSSRRRSMMDDKTASELARIRSRTVQERDGFTAERRPSFNDRGGKPGTYYRPASFVSEAPPITPEMVQKAYRTSSMQQQPPFAETNSPPQPPPHSPRPAYVDLEDSPEAFAPPPPCHSPRPMDITPDPWAAQAAAWKARRRSIGANLGRQSSDSHSFETYQEPDEPLYPAIPPRSGRQSYQAGRTHYISTEPQSYPDQHVYGAYHESPQSYGHSYQSPAELNSAYMRQTSRSSLSRNTGYYGRDDGTYTRQAIPRRPLPTPRPSAGASAMYNGNHSRPQSRAGSVRSFASSLAEELHPPDPVRSHPPPAFSRYSGGMGFGYEKGSGFGGSAGTRAVSGNNANASRKAVPLRASFGIDMSDVPVGIMARS